MNEAAEAEDADAVKEAADVVEESVKAEEKADGNKE